MWESYSCVCVLGICVLWRIFAGLFILHLKHIGEVFLCASLAGIYSPFKRETKVRLRVCVYFWVCVCVGFELPIDCFCINFSVCGCVRVSTTADYKYSPAFICLIDLFKYLCNWNRFLFLQGDKLNQISWEVLVGGWKLFLKTDLYLFIQLLERYFN